MPSYQSLINFNTGRNRCDVTPVFREPAAFQALIADFAKAVEDTGADLVAGIDALGFVLGAALAHQLGKGFVCVRKGGKLPCDTFTEYFVDYTGEAKQLEITKESGLAGKKVLLVDDWIETGAQIEAAMKLIRRAGGEIVGIAAIKSDLPQIGGLTCFSLI